MAIIEINGAQGEGGGQVLRTTLSLSACLGQPVRIRHIRQGRKKPGLLRQHLACVKAAASVCNAEVKGASLGSCNLVFVPGTLQSGNYTFAIGSAGSSTLVMQTVFPILLSAGGSSQLKLQGGTHNPMAPCYDFVEKVFLPVLQQAGLCYQINIDRYGFYPVGGGAWRLEINAPEVYQRITLKQRGQLLNHTAQCLSVGIPAHIGLREKNQLMAKLHWSEQQVSVSKVHAIGSGNIVIIHAAYERINAVLDSIGKVGVSAERVAFRAAEKWLEYQHIGAPVGEHLADQLLLPLLVMAGGSFVTGPLSSHTRTNIEVIRQLCGAKIKLEEISPKKQWRITVNKMTI